MSSPEQLARRARRITAQLDALAEFTDDLSAERLQLVHELHRKHGWSTRRIAAGLGVSQPRIVELLSKRVSPD